MTTTPGSSRSKWVAQVTEEGYVPLGHNADEEGVNIDPRDEGLVQTLISGATMGASDLNLGAGRMLPGQYHIRHHHPDGAEFYYFVKGECAVHIDGEDIVAKPGTAIYIPAGAVHSMRNDTEEVVELIYGLSRPDYADIGLVYDE